MFRNLTGVCLIGTVLILFALNQPSRGQYPNVMEVKSIAEFYARVKPGRIPAVAFFYSKSECKACNWSLIPNLERVAKNKDSILIAKIDLDVVKLQTSQGIYVVPTTKIYHRGLEVLTPAEGLSWGPIIKLINQAAKLQ